MSPPRQADPLVQFAGLPERYQPSGGSVPFRMQPEEPLRLSDVPDRNAPATAAQAAEIIRLLTDMNALLRAAFGPGW